MSRLLDTNVRFIDFTTTTNQIKNEWGSLVKVLDEVLITGCNEQDVLSIITIQDPEDDKYWLSTVTLNLGHKFEKDIHVVEIKGASDSNFNTVFRVQDVGENFIKIAFDKTKVSSKPNDVTTSGAKIKLAPLGYVKTYSDSNKAIYKTGSGNTCYLRVDDSCPVGYDPTWTKFARVGIYSDINNFDDINPRPGRLKAPFYPEDPLRNELPRGSGVTGLYGEAKWYYAVRTNNSYGLFLFKSIYGNTQHWLTFIPCGLSFSETNTLWTSKALINSINPSTGAILNSSILIKDSNRDLRGELRGIKQFYGSGELQNNILMDGNNSIVLQTKLFEWSTASGNSEQVPYLFSFKNWEL